jgi:hypothetical protein
MEGNTTMPFATPEPFTANFLNSYAPARKKFPLRIIMLGLSIAGIFAIPIIATILLPLLWIIISVIWSIGALLATAALLACVWWLMVDDLDYYDELADSVWFIIGTAYFWPITYALLLQKQLKNTD